MYIIHKKHNIYSILSIIHGKMYIVHKKFLKVKKAIFKI
ncbi:hypothetical protein BTURTLESOX_389 [bacterium endosymbiont of Bathymodiolus sp. 5 South]|jgi:hypothetical protein|nr:hypothetical protein [uncultured Gammaproteobacteria bacterium]SHN92249.1 hypothetical protein BCLUESOX_2407 [bacterium endosymbiont of Bathymodiolus sp. 5 South]CAC9656331.1 hypothetical protein [uncultured Gammaproteobacteria bacterium]SSC08766.1 hypothetical protein BTURTLESOX_389 [bacterium endosymbiont of Bathymodiolus sp. 5 South]VVH58062.1 hypothetical protein BSPCLSOX_553 [uncultured Gammaproteobacteria bacterium]